MSLIAFIYLNGYDSPQNYLEFTVDITAVAVTNRGEINRVRSQ
jgi:hypothetical protein